MSGSEDSNKSGGICKPCNGKGATARQFLRLESSSAKIRVIEKCPHCKGRGVVRVSLLGK